MFPRNVPTKSEAPNQVNFLGVLYIIHVYLVGGLVAIFYFPRNIGNFIIQLTNSIIFQRGGPGPPTRYTCICLDMYIFT